MHHIQRIVAVRFKQMDNSVRITRTKTHTNFNQVLVLLLLIVNGLTTVQGNDAEKPKQQSFLPPQITRNPPAEVAYKSGEPITLQCGAEGTPKPSYRWERDGVDVKSLAGVSFDRDEGNYNLLIRSPDTDYDGFYQCFAFNEYGTAVSSKSRLQRAVHSGFATKYDIKLEPEIGQSLVLKCSPPNSYPKAVVYWGERVSGKLRPIDTNDRVSSDYNGNFYFSNIGRSDARNGRQYLCVSSNPRTDSLVFGDQHLILPKPGTAKNVAPKLMWYSAESTGGRVVGVQGQTIKMKCIFSGFPTPRISFSRMDGPMNMHMTVPDDSGSQELVIYPIKPEYAGKYRCSATNEASEYPVSQDFELVVEASPEWENGPPENQNVDEGEGASFSCQNEGIPPPETTWLINGEPLKDDTRRTIKNNVMTFVNLVGEDKLIIQCNATNKHGGIFANAYLFVRTQPPVFTVRPPEELKILKGADVSIPCAGVGAPKPTLEWRQVSYTGESLPPLNVGPDGTLNIKGATEADEHVYQCYLTNRYDSIFLTTQILVLKSLTASAGSPLWLIILLVILALIIIILIIACIVYRRRGVSAKEKEKDPKKKIAKDEAPFCEYPHESTEPLTAGVTSSAPPPAMVAPSQGSLDKAGGGDSDMDSQLGEYKESEETKFNEDGSFIGIYGGAVRRLESVQPSYGDGPPTQGGKNTTAPALNTFV